jgi:hypothetical protein
MAGENTRTEILNQQFVDIDHNSITAYLLFLFLDLDFQKIGALE